MTKEKTYTDPRFEREEKKMKTEEIKKQLEERTKEIRVIKEQLKEISLALNYIIRKGGKEKNDRR